MSTTNTTITMQEYYNKYFPMVEDYVKTHAPHEQDIYDITSSIMLYSWERLAKGYQPTVSIEQYIKRETLKYFRKTIHQPQLRVINVIAGEHFVDDVDEALDAANLVAEFLALVNDTQRYILHRRFIEQATYGAIARELGWAREKVKDQEAKALRSLRQTNLKHRKEYRGC